MHFPASATLGGLSEEEAAARRAQGLGNSMPAATSRTYWHIVRDNVITFINAVLFLLGMALVIVGRPTRAPERFAGC